MSVQLKVEKRRSYMRGEMRRRGLLSISPCKYSSTTAVPQKLHTVQKIKGNKQKGSLWFLYLNRRI